MIHPVRTQVLSKIHGQQIESSMDQYLWISMLIYICQQLLRGIGSLSLGSWISKTNVPVWDM